MIAAFMLLSVAVFTALLAIDRGTDLHLFGTTLINHSRGVVLRLPGILAAGAAMAAALNVNTGFDWLLFGYCCYYLAALFWILFDISLNLSKGFYWLRIGKTAWIDKQLQKIGPVWAFVLKLAALLLAAALIVMHITK
jgi:hypothetical protein